MNNKLIGYNEFFLNLTNLYEKKSLPNKILLSGKKGIGKSLLAEHLINFIYSMDENYKYDLKNLEMNIDNKSNILFQKNSHPNIFKIFKNYDKKNIEISQIREMIKFQNKSSFNDKIRTILIDDVEYLNLNSTNALLKCIEEPAKNLLFMLINNSEKKIPDTLKSRCIEFKLSLNLNDIKTIINNYYNENIYDEIPNDFITFYNSPSIIISLINFMKENEIDYKKSDIKSFITFIIKNKSYSKDTFINNNLNFFIELFFYKNINLSKKITFKIKEYFYFKLTQIKKYNLDLESFFIEFEEKLLSE